MKSYTAVIAFCFIVQSHSLVSAGRFTQHSLESEFPLKCSAWFHFNLTTHECECYKHVTCTEKGNYIPIGHCMTYEESTNTIAYVLCPFLYLNLTEDLGVMWLPDNISELNSYMCSSHNRKGQVCSECIDGYGPSLTSLGYECRECNGKWQGLCLFFLVEFGPITIFYLVVFVFQINFTSAPVTSFLMYSQIVLFELTLRTAHSIRIALVSFPTLIRVIATFYGIWSLDLLWYIVPPFCVTNKINLIDLLFIQQVCAFYPFFLIALTWVCIELHGRNFRLLVCLWRPFHRCVVHLRKGLDTKADMVDVFSSFFLLSCSKLVYQAITVIACRDINLTNMSVNSIESIIYVTEDLSINCFSAKHLAYSVVSIVIFVLFVFLPVLLLMLYPTKFCGRCLSKCKLGGRSQMVLFTFVEKFYGCYRDGLSGGKDMRSLSGIHFLLRFFCFIGWRFFSILKLADHDSFYKILGLMAASTFIAYVQPYKKRYMNIIDVLLVLYVTLFYFAGEQLSTLKYPVFIIVYLFLPMLIFLVIISMHIFLFACHKFKAVCKSCSYSVLANQSTTFLDTSSDSHQCLIQPISVHCSAYGTT